MVERFTESVVEDAALAWLESLGWAVKAGPEIAPGELFAERESYAEVVLARRLQDALARLNPSIPSEGLEDSYRKVLRTESPSLVLNNRTLHRMLVDGVPVEYRTEGRVMGDLVKLLDFEHPEENDWLAVNQFTVEEGQNRRRPDVVLFVNGLPLAVIELKNPADEQADVWTAFKQFETYKA